MSRALKSGLSLLLRHAGLAAPLRRRLGGRGIILLLHEIQDDPGSELMTGCSPAQLAASVTGLRRDGWEIVHLDEALRRLRDQGPSPPFAVLTFDDGYRDTLTRALPILERLQAPFTVYVPTGAVTRELNAWWLALRDLLRSNEAVTVAGMDRRFSCPDLPAKVAAFNAVSAWVHRDYRRAPELAPTFASYGISLPALADRFFMTSDELIAFARHPLVTIGAHTVSHGALSTLEPHEVRVEMDDNRAYLERLLDREVAHFAYPYGGPRSCGPREAGIARAAGFASAVRVEASPVFPAQRDDPHSLPRIGVRPDETPASLYYRASGLSWAMNVRQRRRHAQVWNG